MKFFKTALLISAAILSFNIQAKDESFTTEQNVHVQITDQKESPYKFLLPKRMLNVYCNSFSRKVVDYNSNTYKEEIFALSSFCKVVTVQGLDLFNDYYVLEKNNLWGFCEDLEFNYKTYAEKNGLTLFNDTILECVENTNSHFYLRDINKENITKNTDSDDCKTKVSLEDKNE